MNLTWLDLTWLDLTWLQVSKILLKNGKQQYSNDTAKSSNVHVFKDRVSLYNCYSYCHHIQHLILPVTGLIPQFFIVLNAINKSLNSPALHHIILGIIPLHEFNPHLPICTLHLVIHHHSTITFNYQVLYVSRC